MKDSRTWINMAIIVGILAFIFTRPQFRTLFGAGEREAVGSEGEYELVTLLPKDAIPSIDNPQFVSGAEADLQYQPDELVLGVEIDGDARAYSIPFLSGHEIVNDEVGGQPIAVTW